jgi:outer membrane immunogenic protein
MSPMKGLAGLLVAGIALGCLHSSASAGGYQHPVDWSGIYIGAQGAYGWGDGSSKFVYYPDGGNPDIDGWMGGGQVGYQRQFGSIVAGIEVSGLAGEVDGTTVNTGDPGTAKVDVKNVISLNGRLGWAADSWLIYATGGYVRADVGGHVYTFGTYDYGTDEHHDGWNIGGGVEYMIARNVSVGLEYRHIDLNTKIHAGVDTYFGGTVYSADLVQRVDADVDVVSARLNFHLNREEPAPLK